MRCSKCNKERDENFTHCPYCGKQVNEKRKKSKILDIVFCPISISIILFGLMVLCFEPEEKNILPSVSFILTGLLVNPIIFEIIRGKINETNFIREKTKGVPKWTIILVLFIGFMVAGRTIPTNNNVNTQSSPQQNIETTSVQIPTPTPTLTPEEQSRIDFINKCQKDFNYSDAEKSFGQLYDILQNDLHIEYFTYNGKAPTLDLDGINIFVGCEKKSGLFLDNWNGYDIKAFFDDNEQLYYIIFNETTLYENNEVLYDYNYILEYYNAHHLSEKEITQYKVDAQLYIEQYLLVPKSAKYSNQTVYKNNNLVVIKGTVEAQNAFGVMIPNDYIVELENEQIVFVQFGNETTGTYIPIND